jgi:hypothetical protein
MAAAVLVAAGFLLGRQSIDSGMGLDPALYRKMQQELPEVRARAGQLARELDIERTRREVDRRSLEMVRSELAAQKEEIAALEEGLRFYRGLMAPGDTAQGLSLRDIELVDRAEAGHYAFRIVAQQEALKHQLLKGELRVEVFGTLLGQTVTYPLSELSDDVEEQEVPLRFRYFQAIEGEMVLPEGFQPEGLRIVARSQAPRKAEVTERFPWELKEKFTHVGR